MKRELVSVSILSETKSLVGKIAEATNEKKIAIYDRAIREYAQEKHLSPISRIFHSAMASLATVVCNNASSRRQGNRSSPMNGTQGMSGREPQRLWTIKSGMVTRKPLWSSCLSLMPCPKPPPRTARQYSASSTGHSNAPPVPPWRFWNVPLRARTSRTPPGAME